MQIDAKIDALRQEVELTLREALAGRTALLAEVEAAKRLAHQAQHSWENWQLRVARATRHGQDLLTGAVASVLEEARCERDRAAAALTRLEKQLGNINWTISCARAEIEQLQLVENPPIEGRGPIAEVVKRKSPPG